MERNKVLLHACCAPCLTYSAQKLNEQYDIVVYFYNPNIHPESEYIKRRDELIYYCNMKNYKLILQEESSVNWFECTQDFIAEKEGGQRCSVCFQIRLQQAALMAKQKKYDFFCTTLTISPHKNAKVINEIGKNISEKYKIAFLEENFKKNDGFKKSIQISKQHNMFRQTYCGCIYSKR